MVLKERSKQSRGKDAQRNNISAAKLITEIIQTRLGPRDMDKMLVDSIGDITNFEKIGIVEPLRVKE